MKQVENNKTKEHKNNNGGNNNFLYIIKVYSKNISVFSAFLYGIAMVNKNIYLYYYSIEAERFYGIPSKYFYENILGDINIKLIWILIFILILISPPIIKKWLNKSKLSLLEASGYSVLISITILWALLLTAIQVVDFFKLDYINNSKYCWIVILILVFLVVICSFYVYMKLFTREDYKAIDNNGVSNQDIKRTDKKTENLYIGFATIFMILFMSISFLFYRSVKLPYNTKRYEVVLVGNKAEKFVVGEYKDFYILMNIKEIKHSRLGNNTGENKLVFHKDYYELKKKENLKILYLDFKEIENESDAKL